MSPVIIKLLMKEMACFAPTSACMQTAVVISWLCVDWLLLELHLLLSLLQSTAMAAAIDEQKAIMAKFGDDLSIDVLSEMEVLHRNITEALRMHPPLLLVMRYAKQPFSVTTSKGKTYTIPKVTS